MLPEDEDVGWESERVEVIKVVGSAGTPVEGSAEDTVTVRNRS